MPSSPFRAPEGTINVGEFIEERALFDGRGVLIDESVPSGAVFNNDASPLSMNGQKGVYLIFEGSGAANLQVFGAEIENGVVVGIYPVQQADGTTLTASVTTDQPVLKCWPDVYVEYLVIRGTNTAGASNSIYVRAI